MDLQVFKVQEWLNLEYGDVDGYEMIKPDGITGNLTVQALIRALQIELQVTPIDGIMGLSTAKAFDNYYPNGLSKETYSKNRNIMAILTGGFYCRGIDPGSFTTLFDDAVLNAVKTLQDQIGIEQNGIVNSKLMGAVLTTNAFTLSNNGDSSIRLIQQDLNDKYSQYFSSYIPTNGIVARETMDGLLMGVQAEIGATVDGFWGNETISKLPTIPSSQSTQRLVYLLQYALYINGYDPNGFDGLFGNGVIEAIKKCQSEYLLTVDGYCGKQTWGALLVSCGDTTRSANACDTRFKISNSSAQKLANDGYEVIGRYIVGGDYKELREGELNIIFSKGMKAFLIYQRYDRNITNFGPIEGGRAAVNANGAIIKHKIPVNSTIYFAIDLDVYEHQIETYVIPYFEGIKKYFNSNYNIGIYGPRLVCQKVIERGLAKSCFLADMSYKFSCNVGQKIPENWSFDQYQEVPGYYQDPETNESIDIDKVIYSGNGNTISSISNNLPNFETVNTNSGLYNKLDYVYNLAKNFSPNSTVAYWNYLVLYYFSYPDYSNAAWRLLAGYVPGWIDYVNSRLPDNESDETYSPQTYIYDRKLNYSIKIAHLAIVLESILNNSTVVFTTYIDSTGNEIKVMAPSDSEITFSNKQSVITDLCGWAGDLIQLLGNTDIKVGFEGTYNSIGSEGGTFDLEDLVQDIDAVNLFKELKNTPIKDVFYNYYENDNNYRFSNFIKNRVFIGSLPSQVTANSSNYEIAKALAHQYVAKEGIIPGILVELFNFLNYNGYDSKAWDQIAPEAFAKRINNYIVGGM